MKLPVISKTTFLLSSFPGLVAFAVIIYWALFNRWIGDILYSIKEVLPLLILAIIMIFDFIIVIHGMIKKNDNTFQVFARLLFVVGTILFYIELSIRSQNFQ
jgi:hypothetical protein